MVQGEQFMRWWWPEKNDEQELRLEIKGSLHERMSLQKVRHQEQVFLRSSEVDLVGAVTTQSYHDAVSSSGLFAS